MAAVHARRLNCAEQNPQTVEGGTVESPECTHAIARCTETADMWPWRRGGLSCRPAPVKLLSDVHLAIFIRLQLTQFVSHSIREPYWRPHRTALRTGILWPLPLVSTSRAKTRPCASTSALTIKQQYHHCKWRCCGLWDRQCSTCMLAAGCVCEQPGARRAPIGLHGQYKCSDRVGRCKE